MQQLMRWAAAHQVLVTADEVQSGMGRTGRMFAFEHYGITPDLIACGKGLSSSLPVSAVIGRQAILDLAAPGEMSSTFGGNPGMCRRRPRVSGDYRTGVPGGTFGKARSEA